MEVFLIIGAFKGAALSPQRDTAVDRAFRRLLPKVRMLAFNAVEITRVVVRGFLGFHYVTIAAQARHIQKGLPLQKYSARHRDQGNGDSARR